ncbi:MAG: SH3 domain-containing protein, partial [Thermoguttaceae bacterium]|nr:SH3 domain-containing protein [Thermoguttaceae bacterium]
MTTASTRPQNGLERRRRFRYKTAVCLALRHADLLRSRGPAMVRSWIAASVLLSLSAYAAALEFPYSARVTVDGTYIRSGPGYEYYPAAKLAAGSSVEVYRHDTGDWCAIRPPDGSFSWVPARYLKLGPDGVAEVIALEVPARVGSHLSDVRDVV